jgi:hypothetical protein
MTSLGDAGSQRHAAGEFLRETCSLRPATPLRVQAWRKRVRDPHILLVTLRSRLYVEACNWRESDMRVFLGWRHSAAKVALALLASCLTTSVAFADANLPGRDCNARFNCKIAGGGKCWFEIATSKGTKLFVVPAGQSRTLFGLTRGDIVCDSTRGPPPNGPAGHCHDINMSCARN